MVWREFTEVSCELPGEKQGAEPATTASRSPPVGLRVSTFMRPLRANGARLPSRAERGRLSSLSPLLRCASPRTLHRRACGLHGFGMPFSSAVLLGDACTSLND
jgi:hypothetical protein